MAGNSLGRAVVEFGASIASLQTDANRAVGVVDKAVADINVSLNKAGTGANFNGISSQIKSLQSDFASLQSTVSTVFGVGIGAGAVREVMAYADAWQGANNRIQTTISTAGQLPGIQRQVFDIAQQTGAAFDDSSKMYQRLEQSIESSGKSRSEAQQQAIALTKTLNQEIVVSGASAGEASRSIMDLVHGLSGGVIHAQQLRPIMRQMPDLAKQIADGLGLSAAQFEEMVHKGLSATDVLKALDAQSGSIEAKFTSLPGTFARAWQQLDNSVERYIGTASQASALSEATKGAIVGIADNIGVVATGAELAGVAMAAWLGSKTLGALAGMAGALKDAALAQGAYKTEAIATAEADLANAAATKAALAATIAQADARNDLRAAELTGLNATTAALNTEIVALERETIAGNNVLASQERLSAARTELAVATARVAELEGVMAASQAKAVLAERAETAATAELAASKVALAGAQAEAASATGILSRAGSGLLAIMGGWPGVVIAAGAALLYFANQSDAASDEIARLTKEADDLGAKNATLAQSLFAVSHGLDITKMSVRDKTQADVEQLESMVQSATWFERISGRLGDYQAALNLARGKVEDLDKAQAAVDFQKFVGKVQAAAMSIRDMFSGNKAKFDIELDAKNDELFKKIDKETESEAKRVATFGLGRAATIEWERSQALATATAHLTGTALETETRAIFDHYDKLITLAQATDADTASKKANAEAIKSQGKALHDLVGQQTAMKALTDYADKLATKVDDSLAGKAYAHYNEAVKKANDLAEAAVKAGNDVNAVIAQQNTALAAAKAMWDQESASIGDFDTVLTKLHDTYAREEQLAGMTTAQRRIAVEVEKAEAEALKELQKIQGSSAQLSPAQVAAIQAETTAHLASVDAIEAHKAVIQEWESIATSGLQSVGNTIAQFATGGIKSWHDFGQSLLNDAKQFIAAIIEQFLKLTVFNGIIGALFGGGQSNMSFGSAIASMFGGSGEGLGGGGGGFGGGFGALGTAYQAYTGYTTGGIGGAFNSVLGLGSAGAGAGALGTAGAGFEVATTANLSATSLAGSAAAANGTAAAGASTLAAVASWIPIIGLIIMGMAYDQKLFAQGWRATTTEIDSMRSGMQFNGLTGNLLGGGNGRIAYTPEAALTYGYTPGQGISLQAGQLLQDLGISDEWASILSGSSLTTRIFGHQMPKLVGGTQTTAFDSSGVSGFVDANIRAKGGWFSSDKNWTEHHDLGADDAAIKAAQDFFDALTRNNEQFAAKFNAEVGELVGGTFAAKFDKNGKATGETTSTIGGREYANETMSQFQQRLIDENDLAILSQFDEKLQDSVDKYRGNVDELTALTQSLTNAQLMMQDGSKFLALGADQSLSALIALAEGVQQMGETIAQTIDRLAQAQAQYDQFVGQFKAPTKYVDDFEASLSNINATMLANIKHADELARAAGAEGASTQDLINIHARAAEQFAALVQQLQNAAQSLAFDLGVSNVGSLDQVNSEIERLQGLSDQASNSIGGFGGAIQSVADRAKSAMDLLLGSLSPLNDQEKLQKALEGLRAGTVTQQQVLEIGRRLYASSQKYNDLFSIVQQYPGGSGGGDTSRGGSEQHVFSEADRARLDELLKERDQLQAANQLQRFQTLAQQIAEISSAKGEDWRQVLEDMHIDIAAFEKGLGLTDQQTEDYIKGIQSQTDSNKENTESIVAAIDHLGDRLTGVNDKPLVRSDHPHGEPGGGKPGIAPSKGRGSEGGEGNRGLEGDENTKLLRRLVRLVESPVNGPRNLRVRVQ